MDPSESPPSTSTGTVRDHSIHLLLDFPGYNDAAAWELETLAVEALPPEAMAGLIHPSRANPRGPARLLFEAGHLDLPETPHPAVLAALHPRGTEATPPPCLRLNARGLAVVNGEWARPEGDPRRIPGFRAGRGLLLPLGAEHRARLALTHGGAVPEAVTLRIAGLALLRLSDDFGLALIEVRVEMDRITLPLLQEIMHILAHAERRGTLAWACEEPALHRFTIRDLTGALLARARCRPERVYAYCFALLPALPADAEVAAWRLSRHYTDAYHPGPDFRLGGAVIRAFDDVIHAASLEGAATLAAAGSTFLAAGFHDRVRRIYLPLVILAYHEHARLLDLGQGALSRRPEALRRLVDRFLTLRLRVRVPLVSHVTAHNLFHEALRHGLRIEALTRKIMDDVAQAEDRLRDLALERAAQDRARDAASHHRRERSHAPVVGLFAGMLTFLTTHTALKEVLEALPHHGPKWLPVAVATVLALVSGVVTARRHRDAHRPHASHADSEIDEEIETERRVEGIHIAAERSGEGRG